MVVPQCDRTVSQSHVTNSDELVVCAVPLCDKAHRLIGIGSGSQLDTARRITGSGGCPTVWHSMYLITICGCPTVWQASLSIPCQNSYGLVVCAVSHSGITMVNTNHLTLSYTVTQAFCIALIPYLCKWHKPAYSFIHCHAGILQRTGTDSGTAFALHRSQSVTHWVCISNSSTQLTEAHGSVTFSHSHNALSLWRSLAVWASRRRVQTQSTMHMHKPDYSFIHRHAGTPSYFSCWINYQVSRIRVSPIRR